MKTIGALADYVLTGLAGLGKKCVVQDFVEFCADRPTQRALVSYLVLPLLLPSGWRDRIKFSNHGIAQEIPRALNELGYAADIVNFDNRSWLPAKPYDLFIGHAGINFERISKRLPARTVRIYFSTGIYWREHNARLQRRLNDLASRKGAILPPYRSIVCDEEYGNETADGIVCLGNNAAAATYSRFPKVIGIHNAIYPTNWEGYRDKQYDAGRHHFLFFSGGGNVLKGLDLLLEAFSQTHLHLHICQHIESDFQRAYQRELTQCPNIHVHGHVRMRSPRFYELVKKCNWVISATCAEGQPGSILECMGHGLIPIVPVETNIDLEGWGIFFSDCTVRTIRETVLRASAMGVEVCKERSTRIAESTRLMYSVENFRRSLTCALTEIVHDPTMQRTAAHPNNSIKAQAVIECQAD